MKFMILAPKFSIGSTDPWLLDDLTDELANAGHQVLVIAGSARDPGPRGTTNPDPRICVVNVGVEKAPRHKLSRLFAMIIIALRMRRAVRKIGRHTEIDCVVYPTISLLYGRAAELLPKSVVRLHVMWDFFPTHHAQIGSLPRVPGLETLLKLMERWSVGRPDGVLVMSKAGEQFFRKYHAGVATRFAVVPPWSRDSTRRAALAADGPMRIVFGGQLVRGRGIEVLLDATAELERAGLNVELVIAGSGPEAESLQKHASSKGVTGASFVGNLTRDRYAELLATSHLGVAITQADVTSPSFPSKIGDYARVGLPVLIATERTSDVGDMIKDRGAGVAAVADSASAVAEAIRTVYELRAAQQLTAMGLESRRMFEQALSSSAAARSVVSETRDIQRRQRT